VASASLFEFSAKNERWIVLVGLAVVAALGLFVTQRVGNSLMMFSMTGETDPTYAVLLFVMWWTMMMAMMLPSAAPAILTFVAVSRKFSAHTEMATPVVFFAAGYAAIWTGFSIVAVVLQILLSGKVMFSMMMAVTSSVAGGGLLIAAGIYQLSPLKSACLRKCQAPLMFLARNWRKGSLGAFRMGFEHGIYCIGCCWVLMGLLFYGGVMEMLWIVGLAIYVAAEKLVPVGNTLSRSAGLLLIGWGMWNLWRAAYLVS
jgi:predicted metal-binding membrane protein